MTLGILRIITSIIKKLVSIVAIYCINAIIAPISKLPKLIYLIDIYIIPIVAIFTINIIVGCIKYNILFKNIFNSLLSLFTLLNLFLKKSCLLNAFITLIPVTVSLVLEFNLSNSYAICSSPSISENNFIDPSNGYILFDSSVINAMEYPQLMYSGI
jgi:hypothetical protein